MANAGPLRRLGSVEIEWSQISPLGSDLEKRIRQVRAESPFYLGESTSRLEVLKEIPSAHIVSLD